MTAAADRPVATPAFSPTTILALVIVGLVALSGLAVLSAYAPELRGENDPGAHALSPSAVGFRGAAVMLKAMKTPVVISRSPPSETGERSGLLVLTPSDAADAKDLAAFPADHPTLIVLSKWSAAPDPLKPGFVRKAGFSESTDHIRKMLRGFGDNVAITRRSGVSRPVLQGARDVFPWGVMHETAGRIDRLQTIAGSDLLPVLQAEDGAIVLARSKRHPAVFILSDPDLLNTQGLADLDTARAGMTILDVLRGGEGVVFDVTLAGYERGRGLGRTLLEPPWLAGTLCAVLAGLLMGLHGLARFGAARREGRAFALGKDALVDNSAGLVRMARREAELAPAYAELTKSLIVEGAGGARAQANTPDETWLAELARLRGAEAPEALTAAAQKAKTRDDLLAVAQKLHAWRLEMMRERR